MTQPLLDPKNDAVFKMLFAKRGNEDILLDLIKAVIHPDKPIKSLTLLNPEIPKDHLDDKGIILDIALELDNGTFINIEMQMNRHPHLAMRALYYAARLYTSQLPKGSSYKHLRQCISIFFLGESVFAGAARDAFHYIFRLKEDNNNAPFPDMLQLQFIEITKILNNLTQNTDTSCDLALVDWCQFFYNPREAEVKGKGGQHMNAIEKARKALEELSADPEAREIARMREKAHLDYISAIDAAHDEGLEQGLKKGREQGLKKGREQGREEGREQGREQERLLILQHLLTDEATKDLPETTLSQLTGLTLDQIKKAMAE